MFNTRADNRSESPLVLGWHQTSVEIGKRFQIRRSVFAGVGADTEPGDLGISDLHKLMSLDWGV